MGRSQQWISCRLMFPGISLMNFSEPFLAHLWPLGFFLSSATFLWFLFQDVYTWIFFRSIFIRGDSHINENAFVIPFILDDNVKTICRNFSFCVNRHIVKDGDVVLFLHHFWVVFVPLVCRLHLILLTDLPVYVGFRIVVPVYVLCFC